MKKCLFLLLIFTLLFSSCSKKEIAETQSNVSNSNLVKDKKEVTKEDLEKETVSSLLNLLREKDDYVIFYVSDKDKHGLKASFLVLDDGKWKCGGESFAGSPNIIEESYKDDKVELYYTFYSKAQENVNDKFVTVLGYEASYKTIITKDDIINIILNNDKVKDTYDAIFIDEENEYEVFVSEKNNKLSAIVIKDECPITKEMDCKEEINKLSKGEELKVKSRSKKIIEEEGEPLLTCFYLLEREDGTLGYVKSSNIRLYDSEELHNTIKEAYSIE